MVARGRLHRLQTGVYGTHPPPYSPAQHRLGAVLACGPGALLSDEPCGAHSGMLDWAPLPAHVISSGGRGRSRSGIVVHRRLIDPRDVRKKDGVPCTSVDRVLIDICPRHSEAELETMLVAAESMRLSSGGGLPSWSRSDGADRESGSWSRCWRSSRRSPARSWR